MLQSLASFQINQKAISYYCQNFAYLNCTNWEFPTWQCTDKRITNICYIYRW